MKLVFSGATFCGQQTLKRLLLVAEEICFLDRPSVAIGPYGTVGAQSPIRSMNTSASPVALRAYAPPSGPIGGLYAAYVEADLGNPRFIAAFLEGFCRSDVFAWKFLQESGNYGQGTGAQIRKALCADQLLSKARFSDASKATAAHEFRSHAQRLETLKVLLVEASIHVTNAMVASEATGNLPVSDDPYFCRLLSLRVEGTPYLKQSPQLAAPLAMAIAEAVIPDEALNKLTIQDLFEYRRVAKDAYQAWTTEIDRLAVALSDIDPRNVEHETERIIRAEVQPKLVDYRNEMQSVRDRLFGDLLKRTVDLKVPSLSLAFLAGLGWPAAIASFAAGAAVAGVPPLVDYYTGRRDIGRRNSMSYLIEARKPHD